MRELLMAERNNHRHQKNMQLVRGKEEQFRPSKKIEQKVIELVSS